MSKADQRKQELPLYRIYFVLLITYYSEVWNIIKQE